MQQAAHGRGQAQVRPIAPPLAGNGQAGRGGQVNVGGVQGEVFVRERMRHFEYYLHKDKFEKMLDFPNLILSYHNFKETPENIMEILSELTSLTPKVVKVSVMAHNEQDVLDLMNYTRGFKTLNPEQDFVTISMGKVGKIPRIAVIEIGRASCRERV